MQSNVKASAIETRMGLAPLSASMWIFTLVVACGASTTAPSTGPAGTFALVEQAVWAANEGRFADVAALFTEATYREWTNYIREAFKQSPEDFWVAQTKNGAVDRVLLTLAFWRGAENEMIWSLEDQDVSGLEMNYKFVVMYRLPNDVPEILTEYLESQQAVVRATLGLEWRALAEFGESIGSPQLVTDFDEARARHEVARVAVYAGDAAAEEMVESVGLERLERILESTPITVWGATVRRQGDIWRISRITPDDQRVPR